MSLKKTSNREINNEENDIFKSWCHDFSGEETGKNKTPLFENKEDPIFGNLIPLRESEIKINNGNVGNYDMVEIVLGKVDKVNAIDRPRMVFNVAKSMKQSSSQKDLSSFLDRSFELDFITKSQQNEIVRILECHTTND